MSTPLTHQLTNLLGPDAVAPADGYAVDGIAPQAVARPADRQGVAETLRWASANGVRVFPIGGGVLAGLGNVPTSVDVALDLSRLNRVVDYQPADLTVTAEAGITLESLRQELVRGDKFVPLEAPLAHRATVGGILATGYSGPMRHSYGLPRDWLIGVSVMGADGMETKAGGRVVKNVTGYDLNKLYAASLGTLAVIIETTFKLAPVPDTWAGVLAAFPSMAVAVEAGRALTAEVYAPQGLQVLNGTAAERLAPSLPQDAGAVAVAFVSGRPRAVARRVDDAIGLWGNQAATTVERLDETDARNLLSSITDLGWGDPNPPELGMKVSLPPNNVGPLLASLTDADGLGIVADPGFGVALLYQWGGETGSETSDKTLGRIESVRRSARKLGGTVVVEICPPDVKAGIDVWEGATGPSELAIMRRIKHNFDPSGTLNPGRFIGRI